MDYWAQFWLVVIEKFLLLGVVIIGGYYTKYLIEQFRAKNAERQFLFELKTKTLVKIVTDTQGLSAQLLANRIYLHELLEVRSKNPEETNMALVKRSDRAVYKGIKETLNEYIIIDDYINANLSLFNDDMQKALTGLNTYLTLLTQPFYDTEEELPPTYFMKDENQGLNLVKKLMQDLNF